MRVLAGEERAVHLDVCPERGLLDEVRTELDQPALHEPRRLLREAAQALLGVGEARHTVSGEGPAAIVPSRREECGGGVAQHAEGASRVQCPGQQAPGSWVDREVLHRRMPTG